MLHREKTYIVGDRVLIGKQQGTVKYIGELISSNKIWIGVSLEMKNKNIKQQLLQPDKFDTNYEDQSSQQSTNNDGTIDNITYIESKNKNQNVIFIEPSKIKKWLRGVGNKHLSRKFHINQHIWVKPIKCKAVIKAMFYETPKYILEQVKQKKGKQYLGLLLQKPFSNNTSNTIKYFECPDKYDYFVKTDQKQIIPLNEYNERLSSYNLELIIDHWCSKLFSNMQLAQELICLLISFFGAMDGSLNLKENEVHKYREHCLNFEDYYEYDSVRMGKGSRLIGGKLICIKCFGDFIMDETAEISVSATVNLYEDEIHKINETNNILKFGAKGRNPTGGGAKGGGIIKIICFGKVIIRKNALIQANGENGNLIAKFGAGGTIYIKCEKLINHGKIIAVGWSDTGPSYHYNGWYFDLEPRNGSTHQNGKNGQIIIDGKYTEYGCMPTNSRYCGPILMPAQKITRT